jgi:hypothetical protein
VAQGADLEVREEIAPSRVFVGASVVATIHVRNLGALARAPTS